MLRRTIAPTARDCTALGYESWDAYCNTEFAGARLRLPREERQEVVASLRDSGLSIRAIVARLNEQGILSKRGGQWHPTTVARLLSPEAREKARQQSATARAAHKEQQRRDRAARLLNQH